ncbi:Methionine ABC transporter permease protein [Klebsiella pneumoniae IS53]|nr:Methionine ABC transporter permease protein [Klebsiella pneumoniae IS53]
MGGGGIGDLAITYGYQRFDAFATLTTALVLIVIVQLIQTLGTRLARRCAVNNCQFAPGSAQ